MRHCTSNTRQPRACPRAPEVDAKLLAWGHAAASRANRRLSSGRGPTPLDAARVRPIEPASAPPTSARRRIPPLWLFTDAQRLPDPRAAVARLPRGLAGVVFRHDRHPDRANLGRDLARICLARRLPLVVAGDGALAAALRAGVHLRAGRWSGRTRTHRVVTSSAHGVPDLRRAILAGADVIFLSPVFATASHPGTRTPGPARWCRLALGSTAMMGRPAIVAALGGIDGVTVRRLPRHHCRAIGAIGALA